MPIAGGGAVSGQSLAWSVGVSQHTGNQAGLPLDPMPATLPVSASVANRSPMFPAAHPGCVWYSLNGYAISPAYLHQNPSGPILPQAPVADGPLPGTMLQGLLAGLTPRQLAVLAAKISPDPVQFISTPRNYFLGG